MASLGQLRLDLIAHVGGFTGPLANARSSANRNFAKIQRSAKEMASAVTATVVAATAAGTAVTALTKQAADNAREVTNMAQVSNATTAEFQRYAFAANTVGIEQEKLSDIFKDFNDRIGDFKATGAGPMVDFFENIAPKVGLTAESFKDLSGPQAMQLYFDGLQKANLSQADMTFYLEAMASDVTSLIPLLANGGEKFEALGDRAEELGVILTDFDLAKFDEFSRVSTEMEAHFTAITNQIGSELAPYITQLGEDFLSTADDVEAFGDIAEKAVYATAAVIGVLADSVEAVNRTFQLGGNAVAGFALAVKLAMISAAEEITSGPIDRINWLIEAANKLPGIDIELVDQPDFVKSLQQSKDEAYRAYAESTRDFEKIWGAEWPSQNIENWISKVQGGLVGLAVDAADTKKKIVELPKTHTSTSGTGTSAKAEADAEEAKALEKLNAELRKQESAYTALLARLYPLEASQKKFREEMNLLNLADAAGEIDDFADAQKRLREASAASIISGSGMDDSAPSFGGLPFEVGGLSGEMDKIQESQDELEKWRKEQLDALEEYRQARADLEEQWDEREVEIAEEFAEKKAALLKARDDVALASAESTAGSLADIAKAAAGEQSAAYKAMFVAQKAFAIASSIVAVNEAIAKAAASGPFPYNLAAMASVAAATAGLVSNITSVAAPDGMAHDGIDSVPQDGTWLLQKGERVTTAGTSAKLDKTLSDVQRSQSGGGGEVNLNIIEDPSKAGQYTSEQKSDGSQEASLFVADIYGAGRRSQALEKTYGLKRKGT